MKTPAIQPPAIKNARPMRAPGVFGYSLALLLGLLLGRLHALGLIAAHLMIEQLVDQRVGQHRVAFDDSRNQRFGDFDLILLDRQAGRIEVCLRRLGDGTDGVQNIAKFALRRDALRIGGNVGTITFDGGIDVTGRKRTAGGSQFVLGLGSGAEAEQRSTA